MHADPQVAAVCQAPRKEVAGNHSLSVASKFFEDEVRSLSVDVPKVQVAVVGLMIGPHRCTFGGGIIKVEGSSRALTPLGSVTGATG